jgi:hypothetical protein
MEQLNQEPETDMTAAEYFNGEESPLTLDKILQPQERDFLLEHIELYAQGKVNQFKASLAQRDSKIWDAAVKWRNGIELHGAVDNLYPDKETYLQSFCI